MAGCPTTTRLFALPVAQPEFFDAVVTTGTRLEIQVKTRGAHRAGSGVRFGCRARCCTTSTGCGQRGPRDEYIGTLVNAYLAEGGEAVAVPPGTAYVDVGTLGGYREAMRFFVF